MHSIFYSFIKRKKDLPMNCWIDFMNPQWMDHDLGFGRSQIKSHFLAPLYHLCCLHPVSLKTSMARAHCISREYIPFWTVGPQVDHSHCGTQVSQAQAVTRISMNPPWQVEATWRARASVSQQRLCLSHLREGPGWFHRSLGRTSSHRPFWTSFLCRL